MNDLWFNTKEASNYLGISIATLYRMEKNKILVPQKTPGGQRRYKKNLLDKYLNESKNFTSPQNPYKYKNENANLMVKETVPNYKHYNLQKPIFNNYFDKIFKTSFDYLKSILTKDALRLLIEKLRNAKCVNIQDYIYFFNDAYCEIIKRNYQEQTNKNTEKELVQFIENKNSHFKLIWGDCLNVLKKMNSESIHLMVTSPPYYNAREYSQWNNLSDYLDDMKNIIKESYRVLDNHRVWVFNVGDVFDNDNLTTKSVWGKRRLPLGAYFIKIFEECGFTFVDDFIWDKGEVQSKRHKNGNKPYPFYQYPMNCYEHILIFHKHRLDLTRYPCPICGSLKVNGNTQSEPGLQSWECKNDNCFERSKSNRGKRFSFKTNITQRNQSNICKIDEKLIKKWRRDIVKFTPVIKINSNGINILGHSAPFPEDIPEMAINFFTYPGEIVLDPFAGSFTTVFSAVKNNRIGVGIEINKQMYRDKIIERIKQNFMSDLFYKDFKFSEYNLLQEENFSKQITKKKSA